MGHNQIPMYYPNKEKIAFITERTNYYYKVMSFNLKNVGATYHCLKDKIFNDQIGRNMEVYKMLRPDIYWSRKSL